VNRIILLGGILTGKFQNDLCTARMAAQEIGDLDKSQTPEKIYSIHSEDLIA
jgi:hypothetical protein